MPLPLPPDRPSLAVTLDDGIVAELTPLLPEDRDLLVEGMRLLSPESRFTRFGQGRGDLSPAELDYLANVDQRCHVAWGAAVGDVAAGVGRYIVLDDGCAEVAVTVVDRFQRRGLGRALFTALVAVARHDGVKALCFETLPENQVVRALLDKVEVELGEDGGLLMGRIHLADIPEGPAEADFLELMERVR